VVRSEGLVQDWGLFPASELEAQVLVQCSSSPSGYGARRLTWLELGGLWDLPISIIDALPPSEAELMLRAFCKTAPTKVLLAGANLLLNTSFRGSLGGLKQNLGGAKLVEAHGPRPLSNSKLGLSTPPACTAPHLLDEVHKGDSQTRKQTTRWYRFVSGSALLLGAMGTQAVWPATRQAVCKTPSLLRGGRGP
jgi:hypothetical protein